MMALKEWCYMSHTIVVFSVPPHWRQRLLYARKVVNAEDREAFDSCWIPAYDSL